MAAVRKSLLKQIITPVERERTRNTYLPTYLLNYLCTFFLINLLYLLTPRSIVLLEMLTGSQLVKKFLAFYGTRKFITVFTSARHLSLSWANSIQSMPSHPTSWGSILILCSPLRLGPSKWSLSLRFPHQNPVYASPLPKCATFPAHHTLIDFYHLNNIGWRVQVLSSLLRSFLHSPVTSSLLGVNILLSTLFSNNLNLLFSLNVSDQVWHPSKKQAKL